MHYFYLTSLFNLLSLLNLVPGRKTKSWLILKIIEPDKESCTRLLPIFIFLSLVGRLIERV